MAVVLFLNGYDKPKLLFYTTHDLCKDTCHEFISWNINENGNVRMNPKK